MQFQKLTDQLSLLVFQAIGKYIHPTRYTQIIETESVSKLDLEEQRFVSEDQKHSLNVARVHYQKFRSQHVGLHCSCMEKLRGDNGKAMDMRVKELRETNSNASETGQAIASSPRNAITTRASIQRNNINFSLDSERSDKIYTRRRQLFEKRNRKVWNSLGTSDFKVPTLQI